VLQLPGQKRKQRVLLATGSGNGQQSSGLLDDEQVGILMNDSEFHPIDQWLLFHATRFRAMNFDSVSGVEAAADVLCHLAIDQN